MKKFLSMILVLTFIVTTLMSVMVMDVSASEYACTVDEATGERTWTLTMSKNGKFKQNIATGKYIVKPSVQHANGLAEYDLGKIEQVPNLGKTYWHIDFNAIDYKEGSTDTTNVLASANYVRFRTDMKDSTGKTPGATAELSSLTPAEFNAAVGGNTVEGVTTYGGMVKYTFYAYSKDKNATPFSVQFSNPSSTLNSVDLSASKLYSENGIPHKVDMYVWSDSKDATVIGDTTNTASTEYIYYSVVVDGVTVLTKTSYAENKPNAYKATKFYLTPFVLFTPTTKTEYSFKGSDWYVSHDGNLSHELVTRENADDATFMNITVPDAGGDLKLTKKSDNITGVKPWVDTALEAAVLVAVNGNDRSVELYEKYYNNPARIFTGEETNVKLIDRTTGAEVAVADATGTMDDYYFMVNGIYIVPNKIADPAPFVKHKNDPFTVGASKHNTINTRMLWEDYEVNTIPESEPAFGGLRNGFLRITNEPRGSFYYSGGVIYYNQEGYYNIKMPGMVERATYANNDFDKNMVTLQFDIYAPEYSYTSGDKISLNLSGYRCDESTNNTATRTSLPAMIFTTNNKITSGTPTNQVDLVGNAWNTVAIQADSTNTPETGKVVINVYVNGEKQREILSSVATYGETAKKYISFLEYARLYVPSYSSVGIMNDAWYIGDYVPTTTATTENEIDSANVSGVTVSVDNANNLIAYDNADDADYSKLIAAMGAAGYNPVYERVVNIDLVNAKYDEVDGPDTYEKTKKETGILVKRWIESSATDQHIVNKGDTDLDGKNEYEIINANIISAVDNGDGTATMELGNFSDQNVYEGVATKANDIINMLIKEGRTDAATQTLIGFTSVNEAGKFPRVYSLQAMGTELYTLDYDEAAKVATLNYREFGGTDTIPFVMVVAAYDAKGKMLAMDVSDIITINSASEADGVKTKTFTADFGELDLTTVRKYKVFAFNSIEARLPIMANYSMINPAYVAPVQ